jgi:hypothetical protein
MVFGQFLISLVLSWNLLILWDLFKFEKKGSLILIFLKTQSQWFSDSQIFTTYGMDDYRQNNTHPTLLCTRPTLVFYITKIESCDYN